MKLFIKRLHPEAIQPKYAKHGDAGMDLTAVSKSVDLDTKIVTYGVGFACEFPKGYVGLIYPRSSIYKYDLVMTNHVGVVDSGYRGEILVKFRILNDSSNIYQVGDRIAQLVMTEVPYVSVMEVDDLSDTERGSYGFGSSGR